MLYEANVIVAEYCLILAHVLKQGIATGIITS
ncbi:MAG: hypothetical protein JWQ54_2582 [Mucilaginibacter sp.]|nr:hypothetical protein [Mucilaginibacter sp.]